MSEQAQIDGLKFAREGRRLQGELAVEELPRLQDLVFDRSGSIRFELAGSVNPQGKPVLGIAVSGQLALVCQRCLGRIDHELQRTSRLVLIESGQRLPDVAGEDPNTENIAAEDVADVADIVEQEVLLGLPIAPMHPEDMCEARPELPRDDRRSPFAELSKLKKR
jgi:uncharacterized protein